MDSQTPHSPFRMQRERGRWPIPVSDPPPSACPSARWRRQSPACRRPAERPSQCCVHTGRPPRPRCRRPGQSRRSAGEPEKQVGSRSVGIAGGLGTMTRDCVQTNCRIKRLSPPSKCQLFMIA